MVLHYQLLLLLEDSCATSTISRLETEIRLVLITLLLSLAMLLISYASSSHSNNVAIEQKTSTALASISAVTKVLQTEPTLLKSSSRIEPMLPLWTDRMCFFTSHFQLDRLPHNEQM